MSCFLGLLHEGTIMSQFSLRPYDRDSDFPYVIRSWTQCCHGTFPWRIAPERVWGVEWRARCVAVLERSSCMIACDPEDHSVIFGFIIYEPDVLHFVYTKHAFRGFGIAHALVNAAAPELGKRETTITWVPPRPKEHPECDIIGQHNLVYNPFKGPIGQ